MKTIHDVSAALPPGAADAGVAFERMFEMAVLVGELMERGMAARGLTRARATVLWELARGGPVTQSRIAKAVGSTPRNVTGLIDALEAGGFVTRGRHPTDRRATLVGLTEQGAAVAAALAADYRSGAARLFGDLPEADIEAFVGILDFIISRLRSRIAFEERKPD